MAEQGPKIPVHIFSNEQIAPAGKLEQHSENLLAQYDRLARGAFALICDLPTLFYWANPDESLFPPESRQDALDEKKFLLSRASSQIEKLFELLPDLPRFSANAFEPQKTFGPTELEAMRFAVENADIFIEKLRSVL